MKIGILTIIDNNNYGNRLQNYALSNYLNNTIKVNAITLKNNYLKNNKKGYLINKLRYIYVNLKKMIKKSIFLLKDEKSSYSNIREKNFKAFNDNIKFYKKEIDIYTNLKKFDYIIVGSDQVWNPYHNRLSELDILSNVEPSKRISYAASFGIDKLNKENEEKVKNEIRKFKAISVREDKGKDIINKTINRKDVEVLIDPTMLLDENEWDKVIIKPDNFTSKKYILNYFLGDLSSKRKDEINRIANKYNCDVINILDKNEEMYSSGPSEFLYLEKNAFLICTDSFHSSVFAFLFNKPFIIFDREQQGIKNMNSRLDTLLSKFNLKDRKYDGSRITESNLNHNYSEAYRILEDERNKSRLFIEKALELRKE